MLNNNENTVLQKTTPTVNSAAHRTMESLYWYKDSFRKSQRLNMLLGAILAISLIGNAILLVARPAPVLIGMSSDMRLLPITPLSEPLMNDPSLKNWVTSSITDCFSLSYVDWREKLGACRDYFSPNAFASFAKALDSEGHLALLKQKKAIMHAAPTSAPGITKSGLLKGVRTWEVEVPLLITYETSMGRVATNRIIAIVRVQRMPVTDYARGVAITQLVTVPDGFSQ